MQTVTGAISYRMEGC
jgi:hypothetical protein